MRPLVEAALHVNPGGLLLAGPNPVDALTFFALNVSGPASGPSDGLRHRSTRRGCGPNCRQHCGVVARNVHTYVLGEHGGSEVVVWSAATLIRAAMQAAGMA